jgi:hypothetical protein
MDAQEDAGAGDAAVGCALPVKGIASRIPAAWCTTQGHPRGPNGQSGSQATSCVRLNTAGCSGHAVGTH